MIDKPEDAVGKWYVSILGAQNYYTFIVEYLSDDWYYFLEVGRQSVVDKQRPVQFRFLRDPITAQNDVDKLNRGLIHKIFKYGDHLR